MTQINTNDYKRVCVVIPSLDPDEKLLQVVQGIESVGFEDVVLVNDGNHARKSNDPSSRG